MYFGRAQDGSGTKTGGKLRHWRLPGLWSNRRPGRVLAELRWPERSNGHRWDGRIVHATPGAADTQHPGSSLARPAALAGAGSSGAALPHALSRPCKPATGWRNFRPFCPVSAFRCRLRPPRPSPLVLSRLRSLSLKRAPEVIPQSQDSGLPQRSLRRAAFPLFG